MKKIVLLSALTILITTLTNAQILKGKITNNSGEAIPYATVYIQELKQGTTSNTKGDYEIKLPPGRYQVIYQSLGFSPVFFTATIKDQEIIKDVILPLQYYEIPEVRITATGEDPAYGIMRKAIGMAPYHLSNVSYYKAEVYLKGNLLIKNIPKLFQRAINAEAKRDQKEGNSVSTTTMKEGDAYIMESFNEMEFTAPDKYTQKVISVNSTFPGESEEISPMDYIEASFYQPLIANLAISPLSPQAFSNYRFKYLGASPQGNNVINKIQVIPKVKSQQLFEGIIYIIEDLWCLHSVDLTNENIAGKIRIQQVFIPVQDDIWMPVSHKFGIDFSMLGIKADAGYGGSIKYLEVKPNSSLVRPGAPVSFTEQKVKEEAPPSKDREKIEKILDKEKLTNRDMVTLSRLMDRESEKTLPDSIRNSLEIKNNVTHSVEKDAGKKDSAYWAEIRPVPLSDLEKKSIIKRDSIKRELTRQVSVKSDTLVSEQDKKNKKPGFINKVISGHTWSDTTGFRFTFGGLVDLQKLQFNTVDGFSYGVDFSLNKNWKKGRFLSISPDLKWAFSRETMMWRVNGYYSFDRVKKQQVYFRTGITSKDIQNAGSINPLLNTSTTLFFRNNYLKLYETRYITAGYRREIKLGLNLDLSAGFDDRRTLENTTNFSFFKSTPDYTVNKPVNRYLDSLSNPLNSLQNQRHFEFVTNVTFTPRQKYRMMGDVKVPAGSEWPTFTFTWKHGINEINGIDGYRHFDMIRVQASKNKELGGFREFRWMLRAGGFLDNRTLSYYDFFHFNAQPLLVLIDDYRDAFRLPAYYSLGTPEFFTEAHIAYKTPYFLLKYLPGLSKTLVNENLSISWLGSRLNPHYTELGYSLSEVFLLTEFGVFVGFDNLNFRSIGARLIIRLN